MRQYQRFFVLCSLFLLVAVAARAQATRTWVSGVGDDANPCSRTAPCKTFAGAISKTAAGGEIDALDPGGFGAVTITKTITINGSGTFASILGSGSNGIVVSAAASDIVTLRGLSLNGNNGLGLNAIRFVTGRALNVEECVIFNWGGVGIQFLSTTNPSALVVKNTSIHNNGNNGITVLPSSGAPIVNVLLDRVNSYDNVMGLYAGNGSRVQASFCDFSQNNYAGIVTEATVGTAEVYADSCSISGNGRGIQAGSGATTTRIANCMITANKVLGLFFAGGTVFGYGNNRIDSNAAGNGPVTPATQQ